MALLPALLALGCGLIDRSGAGRSGESWCEEEGAGEVAEVEVRQREIDGALENELVILSDAEGNTLVKVTYDAGLMAAHGQESGSGPLRIDYTLDESGNAVRIEFDAGANGTIDAVSTVTYGGSYRPLVQSTDEDGNGSVDRTDTWTYDAQGQHVQSTTDLGNDGSADYVETMTYDAEGRQTSRTVDEGNDGAIDTSDTWDYSTPNQEVHVFDENGDGAPDWIYTTVHGAQGELLRREVDEGGDGILEFSEARSYAENGDLLEQVIYDREADTKTITFEYDDEGRLVRRTETGDGVGLLNSGTLDRTYDFDDAGLPVKDTLDVGGDGVVDEITQRMFDEEGRLLRQETRDRTGALQEATEYVYAEGHHALQSSYDSDGDGAWNQVTTRTPCASLAE